jgi:hypothetical protein
MSSRLARSPHSSTSTTDSVCPVDRERIVRGENPPPSHLSAHAVIAINGRASPRPNGISGYSMRATPVDQFDTATAAFARSSGGLMWRNDTSSATS